ncbi:glycosyltransferase family 1 protein [Cyanobium sp. CH-040]|uniref:glycosyltransferase family 4 protein n=1 Tax=Cyanobium sp. CH-040 TaxID=2823708 RepID=UPI0020CF8081|nr:glycosyltransferase family 1 protein [Cyanobium sp. CH-040]MCP9926734.1 glycosyltransferase family 4 protein [Cyanobium sp. CH-040]
MRIGIIGQRQKPEVGGGYSFQETILHAVDIYAFTHEFAVLDLSKEPLPISTYKSLEVIRVGEDHPNSNRILEHASSIDTAVKKHSLELVWYLDPLAGVHSVPVFVTVFDLAHRMHPFFPEVSTRGWLWDARENHYRKVLPRAARIFTGTKTGKDQIVTFYGINEANILVNPFPVPTFPPGSTEESTQECILKRYGLSPGFLFYPAQFWPHKNHAGLLRAVRILESSYSLTPDIVFTGADHGNRNYIESLVSDLGLSGRVHFLDFIPRDHLPALYSHALCLIYPSFFGPDNLPPLEAFSLGCPVITARVDGALDQLGRHAARYFDPAQPDDIARSIFHIMSQPRLRRKLVRNGRILADSRKPEDYVKIMERSLDDFISWRNAWK